MRDRFFHGIHASSSWRPSGVTPVRRAVTKSRSDQVESGPLALRSGGGGSPGSESGWRPPERSSRWQTLQPETSIR